MSLETWTRLISSKHSAHKTVYFELTLCSRVLHEKVIVPQLLKIFPAFMKFGSSIPLSLEFSTGPYPQPHQYSPCHLPISSRFISLLSSDLCLCLPSGHFPSRFPTKPLYASLTTPIRSTCPANLILLDLITRITYGEETAEFLHIQNTSTKRRPMVVC
jgi:hypothetical protein